MQHTNDVPEGYRLNARGHLVPVDAIKPIDLQRDELVMELIEKARALNRAIADFKQAAFGDIAAFVELSAERYGAKVGGNKGNVTLTSLDGRFRVMRAIQESLTFDEGLQAAKALIDACLQDWTQGARVEIRAIIDNAFQVDKEGNINTGRILSLRRLNIIDERWQTAMNALNDAVRVQCSKAYIRVHERIGDSDQYQQIALDVASA